MSALFTRILCPIDGSANAEAAMEMAVGLQKAHGAELWLVTVFRHHSLLEASMSMVRPEDPGNVDDSLRDYASEVSEAGKKRAIEFGADPVRAFVKRGPPARTIVAFAKDHDCDLIVLGSRGLGDIESYLLGSVSHKVTSLSECPVLVV
ncbi:universal stress protein [Marivibrio halodurans]|uniref:Universal stress protein n=1 Tax=Marivibrio halodurans TaxID=2039722 RepID=A0A8J7RYJ2_9PROT|nr:universal stress protein [Marivibrio halodurans]MBP5856735.1 universal stress protein [Marivibrio halodurans]